LLDPVFPVVCVVVAPSSTGYPAVPHHEKWHHLGDYLACEEQTLKKLCEDGLRADGRSDSPEDGFEGMFFAWGTVLWMSS
jgi:hypothetical protein